MDDLILEKKIKVALEHEAETHHQDAFAIQRMNAKVYSKIKEAESMKKRNWKKTAVIAAAICVFGSMTVLGLGKTVSIMAGSSYDDRIRSYSEAVSVQKAWDSDVKTPERFSNGYEFAAAVPVEKTGMDQDGNVTEKGKSFQVTYAKDGMEEVQVFVSRMHFGTSENPDAVRELEDGTELFYSELENKLVSDAYVMSEEEKELQEAGKLNVAYDGRKEDTVDRYVSRHVIWVQDEITYSMLTKGDAMTADGLLDMAQEIAESK